MHMCPASLPHRYLPPLSLSQVFLLTNLLHSYRYLGACQEKLTCNKGA